MSDEKNTNNETTENTEREGQGNVLAGFVLFKDANIDWLRFKKNLEDDWDITFDDEIKNGAVVFSVDDMNVACSLMPSPIPNDEAVEAAKRSMIWRDAVEETKKHQAHMIVAVLNKYDALDQQELLAKVACSMLKLDNAIGIYKAPTVYEKDFYVNFALTIDKGECPVPIYVYVGLYVEEGKTFAFTSGMSVFGKLEMEVLGAELEPSELLSFMYTICEYVISEDVELKDGETIGFTEEQRLPVRVSAGVAVPGDTIKLG